MSDEDSFNPQSKSGTDEFSFVIVNQII